MNIHKAIFAILTVLFGAAAAMTGYLGYAYMEFGTGLHPIFAGAGAAAFLLFGMAGSYYAAHDPDDEPDDRPLTYDEPMIGDVVASLVNNDYFACEVARYIEVDKIIRNLPAGTFMGISHTTDPAKEAANEREIEALTAELERHPLRTDIDTTVGLGDPVSQAYKIAMVRYGLITEVMDAHEAWVNKYSNMQIPTEGRLAAISEFMIELHEIVDGQDDVVAVTTDQS